MDNSSPRRMSLFFLRHRLAEKVESWGKSTDGDPYPNISFKAVSLQHCFTIDFQILTLLLSVTLHPQYSESSAVGMVFKMSKIISKLLYNRNKICETFSVFPFSKTISTLPPAENKSRTLGQITAFCVESQSAKRLNLSILFPSNSGNRQKPKHT